MDNSDLSQNKSTSPTPGANDADGGPRSPALLAAARASRALAARRVQGVTPMPMTALPQSVTPAVATADAMDGGVAFNGQHAVSTDGATRLQAARQAIRGLTSGATASSSATGSARSADEPVQVLRTLRNSASQCFDRSLSQCSSVSLIAICESHSMTVLSICSMPNSLQVRRSHTHSRIASHSACVSDSQLEQLARCAFRLRTEIAAPARKNAQPKVFLRFSFSSP